jgi:hypothetical protein
VTQNIPSTPLVLDRELLIWAAGFADGEGCWHLTKDRRKSRGREYRRPLLVIAQSGLDNEPPETLVKFDRAVGGLGRFHRQIHDNPRWRLYWQYRVHGFQKVQAITAMLWPSLCAEKRAQATGVLRGFLEWEPRDLESEGAA